MKKLLFTALLCCVVMLEQEAVHAEDRPTSYAPVAIKENFAGTMKRMKANKPDVVARQQALLEARYDLRNLPAGKIFMSGGKTVQTGIRAKLSKSATWEQLAAMTPNEIRNQGLWPKGFLPLPHPNHVEGGMIFPSFILTPSKCRMIVI